MGTNKPTGTGNSRISNGYKLIYRPNHPGSYKGGNWDGYSYEHRFIMECELGRLIQKGEEVHHLDFNRFNNNPGNLILLSIEHHRRLHAHAYSSGIEELLTGIKNDRPPGFDNHSTGEVKYCSICEKVLYDSRMKTCSSECDLKARRLLSKIPELEIVLADLKDSNFVQVGKKYGVSDNAIRKFLKTNDIDPKTLKLMK